MGIILISQAPPRRELKEALMRRLATATVVLVTAFAAGASAGSLPKAIKMVDRMKVFSTTHFVRGPEGGSGGGGSSPTAEARQQPAAPKLAARPETSPVAAPARPARAD
jgi:hypothetical protein